MERREHNFNFNEVENLAAETWEISQQNVEAPHTKLNKDSINKAWDVPRCYQRNIEKNAARATLNR